MKFIALGMLYNSGSREEPNKQQDKFSFIAREQIGKLLHIGNYWTVCHVHYLALNIPVAQAISVASPVLRGLLLVFSFTVLLPDVFMLEKSKVGY